MLVLVALVVVGQATTVVASTVTFKNQCEYAINVFDNHSICNLRPGTKSVPTYGCEREIPNETMYRNGQAPSATLTEFAYGSDKVWYDISIIPPGPGDCTSWTDCHQQTNGTGFNTGVMILPTLNVDEEGYRCKQIMCQYDGCPDAFHFPTDTEKIYSCPDTTHFEIIYCP